MYPYLSHDVRCGISRESYSSDTRSQISPGDSCMGCSGTAYAPLLCAPGCPANLCARLSGLSLEAFLL